MAKEEKESEARIAAREQLNALFHSNGWKLVCEIILQTQRDAIGGLISLSPVSENLPGFAKRQGIISLTEVLLGLDTEEVLSRLEFKETDDEG